MEGLIRQIGEELQPCQAREVYTTLAKVFGNILGNPSEPKFRRLNKSNRLVAEKICVSSAARGLLLRVGFEEEEAAYRWPPGANHDGLQKALGLIQNLSPGAREGAAPTAAAGTAGIEDCPPGHGALAGRAPCTVTKGSHKGPVGQSPKDFKRRLAGTEREQRAAEDLAELRRQQQHAFKELQSDPFVRHSPAYNRPPTGKFSQDLERPGWLFGAPARLAAGLTSTSVVVSASLSGSSESMSKSISRGLSGVSDSISAWVEALSLGDGPTPAPLQLPAYFQVVDPGGAFVFHGPEIGSVAKGGLPTDCFFVGLDQYWNEEGLRVMLRLDNGAEGWVNVKEGVAHHVVFEETESGSVNELSI